MKTETITYEEALEKTVKHLQREGGLYVETMITPFERVGRETGVIAAIFNKKPGAVTKEVLMRMGYDTDKILPKGAKWNE